MKSEDDEEAQEKKKLGLEQQWQERMNGIRECMFQEGPLFQVVLLDTSTCIDVPFPPLPSHWSLYNSASRLSCWGFPGPAQGLASDIRCYNLLT